MNALVLYATRHGNTRRVAEAIANGIRPFGGVEVRAVTDREPIPDSVDLLIVGGPTEGRRMTPDMLDFLQTLPHAAVRGRRAAAFDTRLRWTKWLSGSAAETIGRKLERLGADVPVRTGSFFVTAEPTVRPDELDRATAWGRALAESAPAAHGTTRLAAGL